MVRMNHETFIGGLIPMTKHVHSIREGAKDRAAAIRKYRAYSILARRAHRQFRTADYERYTAECRSLKAAYNL